MSDREAQFATQLYGKLGQEPGNLFFSPTSVRLALGMVYAGARGPTAEQMRNVLALADGEAAHSGWAEMLTRWAGWADPHPRRNVTLQVVNRLWTQRGNNIRADYLALLKASYRAAAVALDFHKAPESSRAEINRWVSEQTQKKIPELIPPRKITETTRTVLTNAIYFKATWDAAFEPTLTQDEPFFIGDGKQVRAPLMHRTGSHALGKFRGGSILELAYGNPAVVMDVILPSAKDGLPAIEHQLAKGALPTWLASLKPERVDVTLPRFKASSGLELSGALKALGMVLPFTFPGADFSGIDDSQLFLSLVVHQAVVDVDERGTEASAATAVLMTPGSAMLEEPSVFRADHPFLFLIRDKESGTILFMGRLSDPTQKS